MKTGSIVLVLGPLLALSAGCGNLNTSFKTHSIETMELVSIDAKQRVVVSSKGSDKDRSMVTCAEPSPDALSAASASGSANLAVAAKTLGLGYSAAEGAAYIGLRTQTIQLLRDSMFRLCEGYAAGAITRAQFHRLQRHYQGAMVALLAIEQLTGAVTARPASISSSGGAERGKLLEQAKEGYEAAAASRDKALAAKAKATTEAADAGKAAEGVQAAIDAIDKDATKTAEQKTAAKKPHQDLLDAKAAKDKAKKAAEQAATEAEADLEAAAQFRSDARNAMNLTSSATANVYLGSALGQVSAATAEALGTHVQKIVSGVLAMNFREEVCVGALVDIHDDMAKASGEKLKAYESLATKLAAMCTSRDSEPAAVDKFIRAIQ